MPARPLVPVALGVLVLALVAAGTRSSWNLVDDALILCRYAANVGRGAGWAFNPGESIETHSSTLWVALLSIGERMGMDLPYLSRALGVLAAVGLVALLAGSSRRLFPPAVAVAVALLVAGDAGLAGWSISGLETTGFTLLLVAGHLVLLAAFRGGGTSVDLLLGGVAGALALVRPEGLLFGALLIGARVIGGAGSLGRGHAAVGVFAVAALMLVGWRWTTFGSPVPSTVGAKWSPSVEALLAGLGAVGHALGRRAPLVLGALAAVPVVASAADVPVRRWVLSAGLSAALLLVMVVLAGGDWMGHDRLPQAVVPLLALIAGAGLALRSPGTRPGAPLLAFLVALTVAGSWWQADRLPEHGHAARRLGEWLARTLPPDTRLGVAAAGAIPYHSGLVTVDALGITDPVVARTPPAPGADWRPGHMRYDLERFLDARPGVIVWEFGAAWARARMTEASEGVPERGGDYRRELLRHPRFRAEYRPMPGVPADAERYFALFRRREGSVPGRETAPGGREAPAVTTPGNDQRTP